MAIDTFFGKFRELADDVESVEKVRSLVFDLAVAGCLSTRQKSDGDARTLVALAKSERTRLIEVGVIRPPRRIAPVGVDVDLDPPAQWVVSSLAELTEIAPRNDIDDSLPVSFVPMSGIPSTYGSPTQAEDRSWKEVKKAFTHFAEGDIVLAKITPCYQNGKSAVTRGLTNGIGAGTTELHVARLFCDCLVPEYAWIFLKSPGFLVSGIPLMTGSAGQKRIPSGYFAHRPIPLPPLAEQKRIVAKVDALMAQCDQLEAQLRERDRRQADLARAALARFSEAPTPENLNLLFHDAFTLTPTDLRKTILTLAVQGKLIPQDPKELTEPSITQVPVDHLPFEIPRNWACVQMGLVGKFINGDRSKNYPSKVHRVASGIPFVNAGHLSNGDVCLDDMDFISQERFDLLGSGKIRRGDILYCLRGSLGKSAVVSSINQGAIASSLLIIRPVELVDPHYLYRYLTSPLGDSMVAKFDNGSAQPNLSAANLKRFTLPLPPLAEQRRIAAKVDHLMALVDEWEACLNQSRRTATQLLDALIAKLVEP